MVFLVSFLFGKSQLCYNVSTPTYAPDAYNGGTALNLFVDDVFSNAVNIPFQFCYDGVMYNQVLISTNGYLSFNLAQAGGYSDWSIPGPIPMTLPASIRNSILGTWQDIDVSSGGNIYFASYGISPNRRFVVSWNNIPHYSCTSQNYTGQIALYETTYNIEVRIQTKQTCPNNNIWNNNWAVEGVHNAAGTNAVAIGGRNAAVWTVTNDVRRFTNCGVCTVLAIQLIKFDGYAMGNHNKLDWTTITETDNDYFSIERSVDAINFYEIDRVKGLGNSNQNHSYSYEDKNPLKGVNYYRLQSVEYSGKKEYSKTIAIENSQSDKTLIKRMNMLGQEVDSEYQGIQFLYYSDGSIAKKYY